MVWLQVEDTDQAHLLPGPSQENGFKSLLSVSTIVSGKLKEKISLYLMGAYIKELLDTYTRPYEFTDVLCLIRQSGSLIFIPLLPLSSVLLTWTVVDVHMAVWNICSIFYHSVLLWRTNSSQASGSLKSRHDAIRQALNLTSHTPVLSTYRSEAPARGRPFFGTVTSAGGGKMEFLHWWKSCCSI